MIVPPVIETSTAPSVSADLLREIERRVLWLSTAMVDRANARPRPSGVKAGGHQASSASTVSLMTALWFGHLDAQDRVSVKPHAAPVLHAIHRLLGYLDAPHMESLRAFGGLQSYPSRAKDPGAIDFSTGSMGIGATASVWAALARRYCADHFGTPAHGRHVALVGDAELDEGAVWEALSDPMVARLSRVLWVVDVNRQSLDRVVPGAAVPRWREMFRAVGWRCAELRHGAVMSRILAEPGGEDLRRRLDVIGNEEFQDLLRMDAAALRDALPGRAQGRVAITRLIAGVDDTTLTRAIADVGGHDMDAILGAYRAADDDDGPMVVFAHTVKGWGLPIQGHRSNHSALLDREQVDSLVQRLGADPADPWADLEEDPAAAALCREVAHRLRREPAPSAYPPVVPTQATTGHAGRRSTQQAFGRVLDAIHEGAPDLAGTLVTVSPDVATSTGLSGWIGRAGVWAPGAPATPIGGSESGPWRSRSSGRHIELGIAETNLVGLLGELGSTWERLGRPLLPIGTVYDPFVGRALEPWSFAMYAGGQMILVGTPSGVTLAPEGGAHQSIVTPSVGIAQPGCVAWEPAFAQDTEWCLLHALSRLGRPGGESAYLRLSTLPVDQSLANVPLAADEREARRRDVLRGAYRLRAPREGHAAAATLVGMGAVMPGVIAAAERLEEFGVPVEVICLTSADLLFRAVQARRGLRDHDDAALDVLAPESRAPLVAVLDGHPHALSFLGGVRAAPFTSLGVQDFGQSGDVADLHAHHGIDADAVVGATLDLLG